MKHDLRPKVTRRGGVTEWTVEVDAIVAMMKGMIVMANGGTSKARLKAVADLAASSVPCRARS